MAETSIRIADQSSGAYVAMRDAYETDDGGHSREVQLLELAGRQLLPSTIRGSSGFITSSDSLNLDSLPANLTDNLMTVGDKTTLVVMPIHKGNDGRVIVTPIAFDASGNFVALRASKASEVSSVFYYNDGVNKYPSPQLAWDVQGAVKLGLHITSVTGTTPGVILMGGII